MQVLANTRRNGFLNHDRLRLVTWLKFVVTPAEVTFYCADNVPSDGRYPFTQNYLKVVPFYAEYDTYCFCWSFPLRLRTPGGELTVIQR